VLRAPEDSCQLQLAQSLLIQVSYACECAAGLFLLHSICCVAGLLSSSESVPIFFPFHAQRIPRSQTKARPVFLCEAFWPRRHLSRRFFSLPIHQERSGSVSAFLVSALRYLFLPPGQIDCFVLILAPSASSLCSRSRFVSVRRFPLRFPFAFRCLVFCYW
jgi:hypothetical protein